MTNILVSKLFGFAKMFSFFSFSAPPFSGGEKLHVAYKKYKIIEIFTFFAKLQIRIFTRAAPILRKEANLYCSLFKIYKFVDSIYYRDKYQRE